MKQKINYLLAVVLLSAAFVAAPVVRAQTNSGDSNDSSSESQDEPTDKRSAKERIEEHKKELKEKLTEIEQQKIKTKCKTAQAALSSLHTRVNESVTTRTKAYQKLTDRLNKLVDKLKTAGVDITELEAEITALSAKIDTYKTDLANYRQALSDLKSIDCTTDPTAFKAALEAARAKRETLSKTVQDIRTYVKGTIKPTLVEIHSQLEEKKESQTSDNEGSN